MQGTVTKAKHEVRNRKVADIHPIRVIAWNSLRVNVQRVFFRAFYMGLHDGSSYLSCTRFTIPMLASYSTHMGRATSERVNTSEMGVITAATTRIITTACFR